MNKEENLVENQPLYKGIDENLVNFVKAIEFYSDYGSHLLCTENCKECKFQPLCEYRGEINVNLALHLMDNGYGNMKEAVKKFAELLKCYMHTDTNIESEIVKISIDNEIDECLKDFLGDSNAIK